MSPYEPPSNTSSKSKKERDQAGRPTAVPDLDDVQPFMSEPDFVGKAESELETLLASKHIRNPYPYPGKIDVLPSYSFEPSESAQSINLREQAKHALDNAWKYDPIGCSVKAAVRAAQDTAGTPDTDLTEEEYKWIIGVRSTSAKKARSDAQKDFEQVKTHKWMKNLGEDDENLKSDLDQVLDEFYGTDGTDLRPIDNDCDDEGFSDPNAITTTTISLPDKSLMEEGVTPGGIFQDSGICMDEGYAEYSLAHSRPNTAMEISGTVPSDWPAFRAHLAPLRLLKRKDRRLALVGDQDQLDWPGRQQGPYDADGLDSMIRAPKSDYVEIQDGNEAGDYDSEDMAGSFTPHPVPRDAAVIRDVEAAVGHDVKATPQVFGQEQRPPLHGNNVTGRNITSPKRINHASVPNKDAGNDDASVGAARSGSQEGPQHFDGSTGNGSDNEPFVPVPHVIRGVSQIDTEANAHARQSIPNTAFATPVDQRIRRIQQIQMDTPVTPATVNINLTPTHDSEMDADDSSGGSLEVHVSDSPTTNTQKGQSALGRYVEETNLHSNPAHRSSSTISLAGSGSEEVSLIPTQESPSQAESHAGFSKGVEIHQKKNDAVFTLSPVHASPSSSKTAPIPTTPAKGTDSASFRPVTPFQLGTPAHPDHDSQGTPTPAAKTGKSKGKSVSNVFKSPKFGSRSPEHARSSPEIVAAPTALAAGASDQYRGSPLAPFGGQGLLFQKTKKNERGTKNALNSLKLTTTKRGSGSSIREGLEDEEDELAGEEHLETSKRGNPVQRTRGMGTPGVDFTTGDERKWAQAVVVPSVKSRDEKDAAQSEDLQLEEQPRKKKARTSMRTADVSDANPPFEH